MHDATGLPEGSYQLQIIRENLRGTGPVSQTVTVAVAAAEAA